MRRAGLMATVAKNARHRDGQHVRHHARGVPHHVEAAVSLARVHPPVVVHRQRLDAPGRPRLDRVRSDDRPPGRKRCPPAGSRIADRCRHGPGRRPRGRADRRRAPDRRSRRIGDVRRHRQPQDPRRDLRHGGPRREPDRDPRGAPDLGGHFRGDAPGRFRLGRGHRRRLLLQRHHPRRYAWRVSRLVLVAGSNRRPGRRDHEGGRLRPRRRHGRRATSASTRRAGRKVSATRSTGPSS